MLTSDDVGKKVEDSGGQTGTLSAIYKYKGSPYALVKAGVTKDKATAFYIAGVADHWRVVDE